LRKSASRKYEPETICLQFLPLTLETGSFTTFIGLFNDEDWPACFCGRDKTYTFIAQTKELQPA
jgi:hypothetical protein